MTFADFPRLLSGHYQCRSVPGPSLIHAASFGRRMIADPIAYVQEMQATFGDIVRLPFPVTLLFQVTDPELVGKLLLGTEKTNMKSIAYRRLKPILGEGLITSTGDKWKVQRKLANPAFHKKAIDALLPMIREEAMRMADDWERRLERDPDLDISHEMMKLSFRIIARALFSADLSDKADLVRESLHVLQHHANYLFYSFLPVLSALPTPYYRRVGHALESVDNVIRELIEDHRQGSYDDLLSAFINARDEITGEAMSDRQIRDEVVTLMYAGHDTTAFTLAMILDLLAKHPDEMSRLRDELEASPEPEAISYVNLVMSEAMRLFPAAWTVSRELTETMTYKSYTFPKGSCFIMPQYLLHRHPAYWEKPNEFIPERFRENPRHPFAYFPFGGGQRSCIGSNMTKLEIQTILPILMQRFEFEAIDGWGVKVGAKITLIFEKGVKLRIKKRSQVPKR